MAYGGALVHLPGQTRHGMLIPPSYASFGREEICDQRFEDLELDIPGGDGEKTLKEAVHAIILWPKRYIIIPRTNEPSIPLRHLPSPGRSSALGSSSHARSPSLEPFNSGGASDDDDIPPESPPKQPPAAKQAPKRSRAQASKSMPPPIKKQPIKKKKPESVRKKLPYEMTKEENEIECRKQLDDWFTQVREGSR